MTAVPTVSAIIPVHNGARYVAESIRSVLAQSHPALECIVVDDGSTDGTAGVVAAFGSGVVVVTQDHRGVAAARNAGMRIARGDCFAFLDADDVWLPDKLAVQVAALRAEPEAGAAYSGFLVTDEGLRPRRLVVHSGGPLSVRRAFLGNSGGLGFSFTGVVRREVAAAVGGYDEGLSNCADVDFWWRISRSRPVIGVRRPLALYRQHQYGQMHLDFERAAQEMAGVWAEAGLPPGWARRSTARLEARIAFDLLFEGRMAAGWQRIRRAVAHDWRPVVMLPVTSLGQVTAQTLSAGLWQLGAGVLRDGAIAPSSGRERRPASGSSYA